MATDFRVAIFIEDKREETRFCFRFSDRADGVCAEECGAFITEPGDSGELRLGDHAGGVRCAGESAQVQERAGSIPKWV